MAEISWTEEAQRWLNDIFEYIAADNPEAATRTVQGIYDRAQDLKRFPELGSRYTASSRHVRILLYGHYRVAYLVKDDGNIDVVLAAPQTSTFSCHERSHRHARVLCQRLLMAEGTSRAGYDKMLLFTAPGRFLLCLQLRCAHRAAKRER